MVGKGTSIVCSSCGKHYEMNTLGRLEAADGVTEFSHIPDWFDWQRRQVEQQIERGEYSFDDEVEVYSLPRVWRYIPLGKARLTHDPENGFQLEGHYRGQRYYIHRQPQQTNSLHVEYDFGPLGKRDFLDISTENDSFYCCPSKPNMLTKLAFATEIIYERSLKAKSPTALTK